MNRKEKGEMWCLAPHEAKSTEKLSNWTTRRLKTHRLDILRTGQLAVLQTPPAVELIVLIA